MINDKQLASSFFKIDRRIVVIARAEVYLYYNM